MNAPSRTEPRPDPGTATVSEIVRHWAVSAPTARRILGEAGLRDMSLGGWPRYRWRDIWILEGDSFVPPGLWPGWKLPLLVPSHLHERDPRCSARTWRRHVAAGRGPSISLARGIVRVRPAVFDDVAQLL